jgi:hypothetical protein
MNDHIKAAKTLLAPVIVRNPIGMEPQESLAPPNAESVALAQAHATAAMAEELRIQNLIACSQRVFIRDAPDAIREHFGEAALGSAFTVDPELHDLETWIKDFLSQRGSVFSDLDEEGDLGFDGQINIPKFARWLKMNMESRR